MTFQTKRYKQLFLTTLCLLLLAAVCPAQQPFHYKYTIDDGLPFPEVDGIRFTKNGEAWVRYSSGEVLSRFDGITWTHYRLGEMNLPLRLGFLMEDEYGVWFYSGSNDGLQMVCLTPEGAWKTYKLEGRFSLYISQKNGRLASMDNQFFSYQYDEKTDRFIRSDKPLYVPKDANSELFQGMHNATDGTACLVTNVPSENKSILRYGVGFQDEIPAPAPDFYPIHILGKTATGVYSEDGRYLWWDGQQPKEIAITLPNGRKGKPSRWTVLNHWGERKSFYYINGLVVEDPMDGALYLYFIDSTLTAKLLLSHLPKDYFRDTFSEDKHGHWWFGTSSGLIRTDQSQLVFQENMPGMVTGLHAIGEDDAGNIWMGGYTGAGGFTVYDGNQPQRRTIKYPTMPVLPGTCRSASGTLYFFVESPTGIMAVKEGQLIPIQIPVNKKGHIALGYYFHPLRNGQIALGLAGVGVGIATETNGLISSIQTIGKEKGLALDNVLTVSEDQGGRLWCGRMSQGVAVYDPQRDTAVTWLRSPEVPNSVGMMASCVDENGSLWLGTNDGIRLLRHAHEFDFLKENLFDHLEKIPLPGTDAGWVNIVKNTGRYLVFGTNQGVYFFDKNYQGERPRIFSMQFGRDLAGGGAEQNAVLLDSKGHLWIGTQNGTTRLDLSQLQFDTSATSISLTHFQAGGTAIKIEGNQILDIPADKRNVTFSFSASGNDHLRDNLFYDVLVIKSNGDTLFQRLTTQEKSDLRIEYLPFGDYVLQILAYKHNVLSGRADYHFTVPRMLEENPWFWAIAAALLIGGPAVWFYQKKRHQLELEKSKRERDGLKVLALSNFFEPHFINNSLNWVQARSLADPDTVTVIGRLAENVTILYNNTEHGKTYHPLHQELILLKNYLTVQQVRFEGDLSVQYRGLEDENALAPYAVPAMLLQIHAENAVEKGIRGGTGSGLVVVSVEVADQHCQVTIEDNGRGRPAGAIENRNHRAGSTAVMNSLIQLLNTYNQMPITIRFEDHIFNSPERGKHGTRVIILIPKNYHYELS